MCLFVLPALQSNVASNSEFVCVYHTDLDCPFAHSDLSCSDPDATGSREKFNDT